MERERETIDNDEEKKWQTKDVRSIDGDCKFLSKKKKPEKLIERSTNGLLRFFCPTYCAGAGIYTFRYSPPASILWPVVRSRRGEFLLIEKEEEHFTIDTTEHVFGQLVRPRSSIGRANTHTGARLNYRPRNFGSWRSGAGGARVPHQLFQPLVPYRLIS